MKIPKLPWLHWVSIVIGVGGFLWLVLSKWF